MGQRCALRAATERFIALRQAYRSCPNLRPPQGTHSHTCVIARVNIERRVFCNSRRKKFIFNIRYSDGDSRPFPPSVRFSNRAGLLIAIVLLLQLLVLLLRGAFIAGAELRLCGTSRGLPWSPHSVRPIAMPVSPT